MDLVKFPIESGRLKWEARQVLRDLHGKPHVLLRIKLTGTHFPQRALEPFAAVGKVRSLFVEISEDGLSASAYFDRPLPQGGSIDFGYGDKVFLRLKAFESKAVERLDFKKLPKETQGLEKFGGGW